MGARANSILKRKLLCHVSALKSYGTGAVLSGRGGLVPEHAKNFHQETRTASDNSSVTPRPQAGHAIGNRRFHSSRCQCRLPSCAGTFLKASYIFYTIYIFYSFSCFSPLLSVYFKLRRYRETIYPYLWCERYVFPS